MWSCVAAVRWGTGGDGRGRWEADEERDLLVHCLLQKEKIVVTNYYTLSRGRTLIYKTYKISNKNYICTYYRPIHACIHTCARTHTHTHTHTYRSIYVCFFFFFFINHQQNLHWNQYPQVFYHLVQNANVFLSPNGHLFMVQCVTKHTDPKGM